MNGKQAKNFHFKKGTFFKAKQSTYMIIGFTDVGDHTVGIAMRVALKNGRFNIKDHFRVGKDALVDYYKVLAYDEVYIDERDRPIFDEFIKYVNETDFNMKYNYVSCHRYNGHDYWWCNNLNIRHANFKKFKQYSNRV